MYFRGQMLQQNASEQTAAHTLLGKCILMYNETN